MSSTRYPLTRETTVTETCTRTLVIEDRTYGHTMFELCTFKGDRVEVYEHIDGLATFRGYYDEIAHTAIAADVHPFVVAHMRIHATWWSQYLPGAVSWLNAA